MSIQLFCSACKQLLKDCTCVRKLPIPPVNTTMNATLNMLAHLDAESLEALRQIVAEEISKALQADREADEERSEPRIVRWMEA